MFTSNYYNGRFNAGDTYIDNGKITVKTNDGFKITAKVVNSKVVERKTYKANKFIQWIKWGEFLKERKNGTTHKVLRFRNGTGTGKDGLTIRRDMELEGQKGICYTFFCRGRLLWQKFVYPNRVVAYYARHNANEVNAVTPDKKPLFIIKGEKLNFKGNGEGEPFIYNKLSYYGGFHYTTEAKNWCLSHTHCFYQFFDKQGRIKHQGTFENHQQTGAWIDNYKEYFYIAGVPVNKKLYEMPPEKINPYSVLREKNAQARAMLLKKIGLSRVVEKCNGALIHKDGDMALYDFPVAKNKNRMQGYFSGNRLATKSDWEYDETHLRVLKVKCPSTEGEYFLRVPALPRWCKCEDARQGTFNGFDPEAKPIIFKKET